MGMKNYLAIMLPGTATLTVQSLPLSEGLKSAVGFEVSTSTASPFEAGPVSAAGIAPSTALASLARFRFCIQYQYHASSR